MKASKMSEVRKILIENGHEDVSNKQLETIVNLMDKDKKTEVEIHRLTREANRKKSKSQRARAERTHKLCNVGGMLNKYFPGIIELYPNELNELFEEVFRSREMRNFVTTFIRVRIENKKTQQE